MILTSLCICYNRELSTMTAVASGVKLPATLSQILLSASQRAFLPLELGRPLRVRSKACFKLQDVLHHLVPLFIPRFLAMALCKQSLPHGVQLARSPYVDHYASVRTMCSWYLRDAC
jgi:hypothetical protein